MLLESVFRTGNIKRSREKVVYALKFLTGTNLFWMEKASSPLVAGPLLSVAFKTSKAINLIKTY